MQVLVRSSIGSELVSYFDGFLIGLFEKAFGALGFENVQLSQNPLEDA